MSLELIKESLKNNIDNLGGRNEKFQNIINTLKGNIPEDCTIAKAVALPNGLVEEIIELIGILESRLDTYNYRLEDLYNIVYTKSVLTGCDSAKVYKPIENQ